MKTSIWEKDQDLTFLKKGLLNYKIESINLEIKKTSEESTPMTRLKEVYHLVKGDEVEIC